MTDSAPLRIAMVSRGDSTIGGAGRVADELYDGLCAAGHHVHRFLRRTQRDSLPDGVTHIAWQRGEIGLLNAVQVDLGAPRLLRALRAGRYDLVHFHDHVLAWGPRLLARLARELPVVVTFHDASGFTGGCMYPGDCERYVSGCGSCPQVGSGPLRLPVDRTRSTWALNRGLAASGRIAATAPSEYFAQIARRGAWAGGDVRRIPNAVDLATFSPAHRPALREDLGVGGDAPVLLFVAASIADPRKGLAALVAARDLAGPLFSSARVLLVGDPGNASAGLAGCEPEWQCVGAVRDKRELARYYAAADLLVVPSLQDNLPCTVAESLASGTPVVAYRTGGIPEMLDPSCGLLAASRTPAALAAAIEEALRSLCTPAARAAARAHAAREFAMDVFVERHVALYRERIASFRAE